MSLVISWRLLRKYHSSCKVQTVCFYTEWARVFWKSKDWCRCDLFLENIKSNLFIRAPFPNSIVFGEVKERLSVMGEILNELSVVVSEAQAIALPSLNETGHLETPATLTGSMQMELWEMMTLRYSISVCLNLHFSSLRKKLWMWSKLTAFLTTSQCSSKVSDFSKDQNVI